MSTDTTTKPGDESLPASQESATPRRGGLGGLLSAVIPEERGQLPVLVGLVIIAVGLQFASQGNFLSPRNLTNLVVQQLPTATVSLAAVLVLLLGEIDLSLASVAFFGGMVMGQLSGRNWSAPAAIGVALACGILIGLLNGTLIAVLRMPAFIVTLAASIAYQGLNLLIAIPQTTTPIRDNGIIALANSQVPDVVGVGLPVLAVVAYAIGLILNRGTRLRAGLPVPSLVRMWAQIVLLAIAVGIVLTIFESWRGVPLGALIVVGLLTAFALVTKRTSFGRHLFAVGGNNEAARRAGINVVGMRITIFTLASTLAVIAGILDASHQTIANTAVSQTLLLDAIAAAVIGGVSLFGGRGSVWGVIIGVLVIGSLYNGLALVGVSTYVEYISEAVVLLLAVLSDAILRRRSATGLR